MPLYFFDIDDGVLFLRDDEGTVFADVQAASEEAVAVLPDIARDILPDGDRRTFVATLRDEDGRELFRATLSLVAEWLPSSVPRA